MGESCRARAATYLAACALWRSGQTEVRIGRLNAAWAHRSGARRIHEWCVPIPLLGGKAGCGCREGCKQSTVLRIVRLDKLRTLDEERSGMVREGGQLTHRDALEFKVE
jgi:hypothetical protein